MKKTASCKKATEIPISGKEFDHFWNWFGKNKFPGAPQHLKLTFARKYRIGSARSAWASEDGSLRNHDAEGEGNVD